MKAAVSLNCLEIYRKHFGGEFLKDLMNTTCAKAADWEIRADVKAGRLGGKALNEVTVRSTQYCLSGVLMDHVKAAIDETREDIKKSTEALQKAYNELIRMHDILAPKLLELSKDLRQKRTSLNTEFRLSLALFKDIRKFFIEKDHSLQINNINEFMEVCEHLKELIDNGTMDAITDAILKLEGVDNGQEKKSD